MSDGLIASGGDDWGSGGVVGAFRGVMGSAVGRMT